MSVNQPKFVPPGNIRVKPAALVGLKPDGSFAYVALDANGNVKMAGGGGGGGLLTKVVDIGPHSNTGPGDQTKGILNWATTPIVLTADPLATQYIQLISMSLQLKFNAVAYSETAPTQILALMSRVQGNSVIVDVSASSTFKGFLESGASSFLPWCKISNALINATSTWGAAADPGEGLAFGDSQLSGAEFIAGDGTVRITVHYTIDDILT